MSIRATPSSLFDIKARESVGGGGLDEERKKGGREERMEKEERLQSTRLYPPNIGENVSVESE